jgi:uncharacterized protein (DUF433 family)
LQRVTVNFPTTVQAKIKNLENVRIAKLWDAARPTLAYYPAMNRITIDPEQCGGRACIRGMRIRVIDVLDLLANGLTPQQVLEELPDLELEDIQACLQYASRKLNHPVLVAA